MCIQRYNVCKHITLDENLNFVYVWHVKDRAKCHSHFLQVHGISPYPLHDGCRIGQVSFSIACRKFQVLGPMHCKLSTLPIIIAVAKKWITSLLCPHWNSTRDLPQMLSSEASKQSSWSSQRYCPSIQPPWLAHRKYRGPNTPCPQNSISCPALRNKSCFMPLYKSPII